MSNRWQLRGGGFRRLTFVLALVALSMLVGTACGSDDDSAAEGPSASADGGGTEKLTLGLDWIPSPIHTPLYWGEDKGMYEQAGIELDIKPPSDKSSNLKLLSENKLDIIYGHGPDVLLGASQRLKVRAVGSIIPHPLSSFVASEETGIKGVADLKGKTLGYQGTPLFKALTYAVLDHAGLKPDDVNLVNVGFNHVAVSLSGKVDALADAFIQDEAISIDLETDGEPWAETLDKLGVPNYHELIFVVNSERMDSDPAYADRIKRFLKVFYEAAREAHGAPEEATEIVQAVNKGDREKNAISVPMTMDMMLAPGDTMGCQDPAEWATFGTWMQDNGLVEEAPDENELVTNDLLPVTCP